MDTIIDWEYGRKQPPAKYAKTIIDFLGYFPFSKGNHSLGQQVYHARLVGGKTQKQLAEMIGCDTQTIVRVEADKIKFQRRTVEKIQGFLNGTVPAQKMSSLP